MLSDRAWDAIPLFLVGLALGVVGWQWERTGFEGPSGHFPLWILLAGLAFVACAGALTLLVWPSARTASTGVRRVRTGPVEEGVTEPPSPDAPPLHDASWTMPEVSATEMEPEMPGSFDADDQILPVEAASDPILLPAVETMIREIDQLHLELKPPRRTGTSDGSG